MFRAILASLLALALVYIFFDIIGFLSWVASGQQPVGEVYLGSLTAKVLKLLI